MPLKINQPTIKKVLRGGFWIACAGLFLGSQLGCQKPGAENNGGTIQQDQQGSLQDAQVIYGQDNRLEAYAAPAVWQQVAASTVALISKSKFQNVSTDANNPLFSVKAETFQAGYNLCASEPFKEQSTAADCSGSLVAPDIVLTAGHCIKSISDCNAFAFVFDYALRSQQQRGDQFEFKLDQIYTCKSIIKQTLTRAGADFALIRLNRAVVGRTPLAVNNLGKLKAGDPLVIIGHPSGIPQKIAPGGKVRSVKAQHFVANLDSYGGNSGSAVFNQLTGKIEGVLVRGDADFVAQGNCTRSRVCADEGCRGEDVTRIDQVIPFLPKTAALSR